MFKRKKKPESENIRKFMDMHLQFEKDHPHEMLPMETDPQLVVNCLIDTFLGVGWYVGASVNTKQVNTVVLDILLNRYSKEFRRLNKENPRT